LKKFLKKKTWTKPENEKPLTKKTKKKKHHKKKTTKYLKKKKKKKNLLTKQYTKVQLDLQFIYQNIYDQKSPSP